MDETPIWLDEVVHSYLHGHLTKQQKEHLAAWLGEESHQLLFLEALEIEYGIQGTLSIGVPPGSDGQTDTPAKSRFLWLKVVSVLSLLGCLLLGFMLWDSIRNPRGLGSVAKLTRVKDAVFSPSHQMPQGAGSYLGKGWVHLESGSIEITFHSEVKVVLTGPAMLGLDSKTRAFLAFGEVDVDVPETAGDFIIGTANMEVVDLGTKFQVRVDRDTNEADVEVSEGLVDLHFGNSDTNSQIETLRAGQEAAVDAQGDVLTLSGTPQSEQAHGHLFAHWTLDEVTEGRRILDAGGKGRHGIFKHQGTPVLTEGKVGQALDLTGGGHIDLSKHVPELAELNAFTFSAWVRNGKNVVFSFSNGTDKSQVQVQLQLARLLYGYARSGWDMVLKGGIEWEKDRWYHITVSVSGSKVSLYLDGTLLLTETHGERIGTRAMNPSQVVGPTSAFIGYLPMDHKKRPRKFSGQIDDVQIYSRALDSEEIKYLYAHPGEPIRIDSTN